VTPARRRDDRGAGRALRWLQILTSIVAIIALTLTIIHLNDVKTSRRDAAYDSCYLLRGLVFAATTNAPTQRAAAAAYIRGTVLRDCALYSDRLTH
jgi:hypothetical protein